MRTRILLIGSPLLVFLSLGCGEESPTPVTNVPSAGQPAATKTAKRVIKTPAGGTAGELKLVD